MDGSDLLPLRKAELDLIDAAGAGHGLCCRFRRKIRAELLRRLILGLPIGAVVRPLTPVGIRVENAVIDGRLDLNSALVPGGGAMASLELSKCIFVGGFSAAHAHLSRLCFRGSAFSEPAAVNEGPPLPTIDLTNARIDSNLSMDGIRPLRATDFLWIRATGARIDGEVDLCRSHLRAPPARGAASVSEPSLDALGLTLAEVKGDLQFLDRARCEGRISARRAIIRGDVWMSGASLELTLEPGEPEGKGVLFLQSAEIGGLLMLDGCPEDVRRHDECLPFLAYGMLNLTDLQLGGSVSLLNAQLFPPKRNPATVDSTGAAESDDDAEASDANWTCLSLEEARVGDSVEIDITSGQRARLNGRLRFANAEIQNRLTISDAFIGLPTADEPTVATIHAPFLTARHVVIANVEPLLWEDGRRDHPDMMALSLNLEGAKVESLEIRDSWLKGRLRAPSLRCKGDVILDARVDKDVDLGAAEIGGSLDLSELRLDGASSGITLKEGTIGRTLRLTHERLGGRDGTMRLVGARRVALKSLPGFELVEGLWCLEGSDRRRLYQAGFALSEERAFLLDGKAASFDSLVAHFRPATLDADQSAELLRLYCTYVRGDRGVRVLLPDPVTAPLYLGLPPAAGGSGSGVTWLDVDEAPGARDEFLLSGCCISGDALVRVRVRLRAEPGAVKIKLLKEKRIRSATWAPEADHQFICRPHAVQPEPCNRWVVPSPVEGMVDETDLRGLEARLAHFVQTSCAIHGEANLEGLVCGMLDDNSGRAWGAPKRIHMNHFVYSRTTWIGKDKEDAAGPGKRAVRAMRAWAAQNVPHPLARGAGVTQRLRRATEHCAGWQARLNWIYRQFDTARYAWPSHYPIRQADYAPQPFEQAIKVCRAEGREDYALHFEVQKQRVEWALVNRRSRPWLIAIGLLVGLIWYSWTGRWQVGLALAASIAVASDAANLAMRHMFGYLRRPVRAITSLVIAFLVGWQGVQYAKTHDLLVIDAEPVASLAVSETDQPLRMGIDTPNSPAHSRAVGAAAGADQAGAGAVSDPGVDYPAKITCGEAISTPLYALDVLIPLIDLRQEVRCEIGSVTREANPPFWRSERFWAVLKALYAIAGWFIVSFAILTFAQANRTRMGSETA